MKIRSLLFFITAFFAGSVFFRCHVFASEALTAKEIKDQTFYTLANIWYSNPNEINSQNYHTGAFVPAGTKVKIKKCSGREIKFSDEEGTVYTMVIYRKGRIKVMTLFRRYFSRENVKAEGGIFNRFSEEEQKNIVNSKIDYGMSKEAVLMAYGYPPEGRDWAPNSQSNKWEYLEENNVTKTRIYFEDNKVVKIEGIKLGVRRPFAGRKERVTIKNSSNQYVSEEGQPLNTLSDSNADEIYKYKKLLDDGIITKEEFEQKKKQLLGL